MTTDQVAETVTTVVSKQKQDPEISTMGKVMRLVELLDPEARVRVLEWNLNRARSALVTTIYKNPQRTQVEGLRESSRPALAQADFG